MNWLLATLTAATGVAAALSMFGVFAAVASRPPRTRGMDDVAHVGSPARGFGIVWFGLLVQLLGPIVAGIVLYNAAEGSAQDLVDLLTDSCGVFAAVIIGLLLGIVGIALALLGASTYMRDSYSRQAHALRRRAVMAGMTGALIMWASLFVVSVTLLLRDMPGA